MRIVATSDTHFQFDNRLIPDGDVFIHAGDFMYSGYLTEWNDRVVSFGALKHEHKLVVPGNHDIHVQLYPGPAFHEMRQAGTRILGTHPNAFKHTLPNGMTVGAVPYVTNLPGWAFNRTEEEIDAYMDSLGRVDIVVSHSPPAGILDAGMEGGRASHWGVKAMRRYLKRFQPSIWICGHVHEQYGTAEVEGCKFYNVAMCDEMYAQVNPAMVIDL